jgi:hypothetical protein
MEHEGSLLSSQKPSTGTYPKPDQSCPYHPNLFLHDQFQYYTHLYLGLPRGLFPSGFSTNNLYTDLFGPIHVSCSANLISIDLTILIMPGQSISYEVPHYALSSNFLSLCLSLVQYSSQYHVLKHPQSIFLP